MIFNSHVLRLSVVSLSRLSGLDMQLLVNLDDRWSLTGLASVLINIQLN